MIWLLRNCNDQQLRPLVCRYVWGCCIKINTAASFEQGCASIPWSDCACSYILLGDQLTTKLWRVIFSPHSEYTESQTFHLSTLYNQQQLFLIICFPSELIGLQVGWWTPSRVKFTHADILTTSTLLLNLLLYNIICHTNSLHCSPMTKEAPTPIELSH